jgi:hypothetical protein
MPLSAAACWLSSEHRRGNTQASAQVIAGLVKSMQTARAGSAGDFRKGQAIWQVEQQPGQ